MKLNVHHFSKNKSEKALVLSCIDYRFITKTVALIQSTKFNNKFDYTTLPGASLDYNQTEYESWKVTFDDIIQKSIEIHNIKQIIVVDHMDCSAYKLFYPKIKLDSSEEKHLHKKNIIKFINKLKKEYPKLKFSGYILNIDNKVDKISFD